MGSQGNDELHGEDGNDVLRGGAGNDTLVGGNGSDCFVTAPGQGIDRIVDFENGTDKIGLSAFGFHNFAEARALAAEVGNDVVFTFATGDTLTLDNIPLSQLAAVDFVL